jgi:hypothetical protein
MVPLLFCSLTGLHVTFRCTIAHPLLIPLCPHSTLRVMILLLVDTMDTVSSTCRAAVAFSCHIRMIIIHPSLCCTRASICTSLLDQRLTPRDLVFLGWPPSPRFCQSSGTSVSAIQIRPSSVRWPNTALACHHFLPCIQCIRVRRVTMEKYNVLTRAR